MYSRFLLLVAVCFCALDLVGANVNQSPDRNSKPSLIKVPMQQTVPQGYLAFEIPPFSVEFRTLNTLTGDPDIDAALLQSEMATELKQIVGKFVKESFEIEVAKLAKQQPQEAPEIILNFASLDFQVTIQHRFTQDSERRLVEEEGDIDEDGVWLLDFYSEFVGKAFFLSPSKPGAVIPSTREMHDLMLGWMNHNFEDLSALTSGFRMSPAEILNNIESLEIDTNIEVGTLAEFDDIKDNSSDENAGEQRKWGHAVWTTFMIFVCLGMIVVGALLFKYSLPYIVPYFQDHSVDPTHHTHHHQGPLATVFPPKAVDHHERPMSPHNSITGSDQNRDQPLPGRRGDADEELILQQQSDRWLQEHRPDLYDVVQKSQQNAQGQSENSTVQRSMPMQFLLGGMFKSQPPSPAQEQSRRESDFSEGHDPEAPFHDNYNGFEDGSPNWWNKVLQGLKGHKLACDEDPTHYNFPFQDFPRHDGTPCLIYSETPSGLVRVVRTDSNISNHSGRPLSPPNALSNEEFKRVLSLNSEEGVFVDEPSVDEEEEMEDEIVFQAAPVSNQNPEFTDKLNRLVAMRQRHYERQNILNKHKKTREHRVQEEARQRELKLRRHEMELDMNEIEAQYTRPRSDAGKNNSSIGLNRSRSGSTSPTDRSNEVAVIGVPATSGDRPRKSLHRAIASNPDFYGIASISSGSGSAGSKGGTFEMGRPGSLGDVNSIMETQDISASLSSPNGVLRKSPPRPEAMKPTKDRAYSSGSSSAVYPSPTSVVSSKTIEKAKLARQRSHRRSASHGVGVDIRKATSVDGGLEWRDSRRNLSDADDVMAFGIAAYTDFV